MKLLRAFLYAVALLAFVSLLGFAFGRAIIFSLQHPLIFLCLPVIILTWLLYK